MGAKYVFNPLTGNLDTTDVVAFNGEVNLGTAAAPSVFFTGDTNTGIYSPGADQVAISTNGTQRLLIEADGDINIDSGGVFYDATNNRLAIGTTSPAGPLEVAGTGSEVVRFRGNGANGGWAAWNSGGTNYGYIGPAALLSSGTSTQFTIRSENELLFTSGGGSERARIDSSGRLLVGTSSAQTIANSQAQIEVSTDSATGYALSLSRSVTDIYGPQINFRSTRGTAASPVVVNDNDQLGSIAFYGYDGTDSNHQFASISALVDGTPGNNDCPGRLTFSTTADGASSPTERMRITSDAYVRLASGTGGIQFNGDTAAANALDDYEEGTWTVSVADANTGGNVSATTATAHYTKIGRFVECIFDVNNIDTTGLTAGNDIYIRGFPFAWDVVAVRGQGSVHVHNITFTGYLTLEATGGHTTCRITENASNSGVDFIMVSELSSGSARIAGRISGIV